MAQPRTYTQILHKLGKQDGHTAIGPVRYFTLPAHEFLIYSENAKLEKPVAIDSYPSKYQHTYRGRPVLVEGHHEVAHGRQ